VAILSLDWYIWVGLGLLFLYALVRRLVRSWQAKRRPVPAPPTPPRGARASWASRAGRAYASKRP
jgi:hypothetical protein